MQKEEVLYCYHILIAFHEYLLFTISVICFKIKREKNIIKLEINIYYDGLLFCCGVLFIQIFKQEKI